VRQELDYTLSLAFENVWQEAQKRQCSLRTAAYIIAIDRVYRATQLNGIS
jgi:glutamate dehydrogenase (NAD(P)+)